MHCYKYKEHYEDTSNFLPYLSKYNLSQEQFNAVIKLLTSYKPTMGKIIVLNNFIECIFGVFLQYINTIQEKKNAFNNVMSKYKDIQLKLLSDYQKIAQSVTIQKQTQQQFFLTAYNDNKLFIDTVMQLLRDIFDKLQIQITALMQILQQNQEQYFKIVTIVNSLLELYSKYFNGQIIGPNSLISNINYENNYFNNDQEKDFYEFQRQYIDNYIPVSLRRKMLQDLAKEQTLKQQLKENFADIPMTQVQSVLNNYKPSKDQLKALVDLLDTFKPNKQQINAIHRLLRSIKELFVEFKPDEEQQILLKVILNPYQTDINTLYTYMTNYNDVYKNIMTMDYKKNVLDKLIYYTQPTDDKKLILEQNYPKFIATINSILQNYIPTDNYITIMKNFLTQCDPIKEKLLELFNIYKDIINQYMYELNPTPIPILTPIPIPIQKVDYTKYYLGTIGGLMFILFILIIILLSKK